MMRLRDLPIRRKLLVVGLVTSASALIVMSLSSLVFSYFIIRNTLLTGLSVQAAIVNDNIAVAVALADDNSATETLRALGNTPIVDRACVYGTNDVLIGQYARAHVRSGCPSPPPPPGLTEASLRGVTLTRAITDGGKDVGLLYIEGNYVRLGEQLRMQALAALGGLIIGALAAAIVAAQLRGVIADPILSLASTSTRIAKVGDYSLRATRPGNDEIGTLADAFNEMVAGIERRDDQLRVASRLKDEFLATLSHELRTPLNAVAGWLQILRLKPADPMVMERALASMDRNTKAQVRLIEDLLDVSRIITGKLQLKTEVVDLVGVVESALDVAMPGASAKGVQIQRTLLPSPRLVSGDPDRLQQVMWNLLSNAVKFTPTGGRIDVTMAESQGLYSVEVRDTGIGLSPEFLPLIFDRFRQADGSTSRSHGGLGLGLAIVHDLVAMHGGRVEARSDGPGLGAVFNVILPQLLVPGVLSPVPVQLTNNIDLEGLLVLTVDDNLESLDIVGQALSGAGARVELASDATRALAALARRRFDVLVCDLAMPGLDGYELLRVIREDDARNGRRFLPAVAVSAHTSPGDHERARAAGFQAFVSKPYPFDTLVDAVARAVGRV
jgi:signal transduction histidine kinase/CheY-like chemotaxis protein